MTVTLPESLKFGYVTGRYIVAVGDGIDADRAPDARPAEGLVVTFTPSVTMQRAADPVPTTVLRTAQSVKVGEDGLLYESQQDQPGVWLVTGVYTVSFGGSVPAAKLPTGFTIEVTEQHTPATPLYLTSAAPYTPPAGVTAQVVQVLGTPVPGHLLGVTDAGQVAYVPGGGGAAQPSHVSILASGNVTLPIEHPVLTIRADDPATLSLPEAPEGTVVTIHVAHGWENLTWDSGITITGDSVTTETWVVLVRKEGGWSALVSGSGGGGMSGHGRPDGISWPYGEPSWSRGAPVLAPLGTVYTDLDGTDGAVQWTVTGLGYIWWFDPDTGTYPEIEDGPIWEVTVGSAKWERGSDSSSPDPLTPPAGYDHISISARRKGDWVDVEISFLPSGLGQGVPVTVPEVQGYFFNPPQNLSPSNSGEHPMEVDGDPNFIAAVGEPPQVWLSGISILNIPSFEVGAFTAGEWAYMSMGIKTAYRIKEPLDWPSQMERPDPGDSGGGV